MSAPATQSPAAAPRVSVVMPAYNSARTLRAAVESVREQSCPEWDLIVVDDASQDDTVAVAHAALAPLDPARARLLALQANGGPATARNQGVAAARGEWVAFLDADDIWLPWRLAAQLACAAELPDAAMVCGRTEVFDDGSGADTHATPHGTVPATAAAGAAAGRAAPRRQLTVDEFAEHNPVATSTVLVRRHVVEAAGGFDPRFRGPEDYELWMRIAARAKVVLLDLPLSRYRFVPGSLSTNDRTFLPQIMAVLDKAYGSGGVLHGRSGQRRARGYHYLACAWMAAERGALGRALALFLKSCWFWPGRYAGAYLKLPWARARLLVHFAAVAAHRGRPHEGCTAEVSGR